MCSGLQVCVCLFVCGWVNAIFVSLTGKQRKINKHRRFPFRQKLKCDTKAQGADFQSSVLPVLQEGRKNRLMWKNFPNSSCHLFECFLFNKFTFFSLRRSKSYALAIEVFSKWYLSLHFVLQVMYNMNNRFFGFGFPVACQLLSI